MQQREKHTQKIKTGEEQLKTASILLFLAHVQTRCHGNQLTTAPKTLNYIQEYQSINCYKRNLTHFTHKKN